MTVLEKFDLSIRKFNLSELIIQAAAHHSVDTAQIRLELCSHVKFSISRLSQIEKKVKTDKTSMTRKQIDSIEAFFTQKMGKKMTLIERESEASLFKTMEL